ncbi:MAG: hypothetical protein IKI57_06770 [Clostridia bacterium]|nr:hypothetical protein [Clostridia bacterium]
MNDVQAGMTCKNCGAPVTSEICPFCHCATGINTEQANMEYPILNCRSAGLSFWNMGFPLIFTVAFGIASLMSIGFTFGMGSSGIGEASGFAVMGVLMSLPFLVISLGALGFVINQLVKYTSVKSKGTPITATVYGYMNDNFLINGRPAQVVKLLIDTENGKRFILYKLGSIYQKYGVNTQIELIMYNNIFMINDKV